MNHYFISLIVDKLIDDPTEAVYNATVLLDSLIKDIITQACKCNLDRCAVKKLHYSNILVLYHC